jgi:nucleotide-binding universal stress UspA family protein
MKIVVGVWSAIFVASSLGAISAAQSQSVPLGDSARTNKPEQTKAAPRIYDNDNLPSTDSVSVVGIAAKAIDGSDKPNTDIADKDSTSDEKKTDDGEIKLGQSPEERQKAYAVWKKRINQREDRVAQLTQDVDDLKQNAPLSVVVLHLWPDDQLYLQAVVEKQKALAQAKADLDDLQEQARKAGVPSSFRDADTKIKPARSAEERKKEYADSVLQMQARKTGGPVSDSGPDDGKGTDSAAGSKHEPKQNQKDIGEIKPGQSVKERQRAYLDWKNRIDKRQEKIDRLTRELNELKRNVPTAVMLHLWPEDQIYLRVVADKQKELDQAKADHGDLQEQAREAGVPPSFR